jgi:hypothetical protein
MIRGMNKLERHALQLILIEGRRLASRKIRGPSASLGMTQFARDDTSGRRQRKRTSEQKGGLAILRLVLFTFHWVQGSPLPKEA